MQGNSSESETDGRQYTVERILDKRVYNGRTEYFVRWKGYPDSQNTWESAKSLQGCAELVEEFNAAQKASTPPTISCGQTSKLEALSSAPSPPVEGRENLANEMKRLFSSMQKEDGSGAGNKLASEGGTGLSSVPNLLQNASLSPNFKSSSVAQLESALKSVQERTCRGPGNESKPNESLLKTSQLGTAVPAAEPLSGSDGKAGTGKTLGENSVLTPTRVVGLRRVADGSFEYGLECAKEGVPPLVFAVSSREIAKGIPGLIIEFYQKNLAFKSKFNSTTKPVDPTPTALLPLLSQSNEHVLTQTPAPAPPSGLVQQVTMYESMVDCQSPASPISVPK